MEKDFEKFIDTLQNSIFTWDYFTDFNKVKKNVVKIERELNLLNSLIGKDNIEDEFIDLIKEYPKIKKALPILIAVRKSKLRDIPIITDIKELKPEHKTELFYNTDNECNEHELKIFFKESGLINIFKDKNIKSVVDYVFGVEVGMDTNGRKNRTGTLMENIVFKFLKEYCSKNTNYKCMEQATKKKIKELFDYDIEIDKTDRIFDFAIFNSLTKKLVLIEVNYYSAGGTKLKATAGEYQKLDDFIKKQEIDFIWITDGKGWLTALNSLEETYNHNKYVINLAQLKNGAFHGILEK